MALNRAQRRAMLAAELDGDQEGDVQDVDTVDPTPAPQATPAVTLTLDQIQGMISAAVTAAVGAQTQTGDIASAIAGALKDNRQPIPENTDADYHGRSEYNPEGKAVPRPELPCDYWLATWDPKTERAAAQIEIEASMITNDEIRELAKITPGTYRMEKSDGKLVTVQVVDEMDSHGALRRRLLAFPKEQFSKEHRNELGLLRTFHQRMTAA